jgi:hypothetical protein
MLLLAILKMVKVQLIPALTRSDSVEYSGLVSVELFICASMIVIITAKNPNPVLTKLLELSYGANNDGNMILLVIAVRLLHETCYVS